jgi:hypothetical protein
MTPYFEVLPIADIARCQPVRRQRPIARVRVSRVSRFGVPLAGLLAQRWLRPWVGEFRRVLVALRHFDQLSGQRNRLR